MITISWPSSEIFSDVMDTENYSYNDLSNEVKLNVGRMNFAPVTVLKKRNLRMKANYILRFLYPVLKVKWKNRLNSQLRFYLLPNLII